MGGCDGKTAGRKVWLAIIGYSPLRAIVEAAMHVDDSEIAE
jgi:hypothetical protein